MLDGLEKLTFADVASQNAEKQAELGVADGKGPRIVAKNGGGATLVDLHVGKTVGGYTMMRVDGKNETWQASGIYPYTVARAPSGWRDHAIFALTAGRHRQAHRRGAGRQAGVAARRRRRQGQAERRQVEDRRDLGDGAEDVGRSRHGAGQRRRCRGCRTCTPSDFADDKKVDQVKGTLALTVDVKGTPHTLWVGGEQGRRRLRGVERLAAGLHRQEVLDRAHRQEADRLSRQDDRQGQGSGHRVGRRSRTATTRRR